MTFSLLDATEYIEDITCPLVDMNFIFECSTRHRVEHEKIKFISISGHVIFCLLYKHGNNDAFDDFPKFSDHFPKISKDFPKLFQRLTNVSEHFPNIFWRLPKITKDFRVGTKAHLVFYWCLGNKLTFFHSCDLSKLWYKLFFLQVAVMTDNQYSLLKHLYSEVQVRTVEQSKKLHVQVLCMLWC